MKTRFKNHACFYAFTIFLVLTACHTGNSNNNSTAASPGAQPVAKDSAGKTGTYPQTAKPKTNEKLLRDASKFLADSYELSLYEVELSQIAEASAVSPAVKKLAANLITTDMDITAKVNTIAANEKLLLPTTLTADHQKEIVDIPKITGAAFDKKFVSAIVSDHQSLVNSYTNAAEKAATDDIKNFAKEILPKIKDNLAMAKKITG